MEDLSGIFARMGSDPFTGLITSSMAAGNSTSSSRLALTAPGSEPVDPVPPSSDQSNPALTATAYDTGVSLRDPDGGQHSPDRADRSNPFASPDGSGWNTGRGAADPLPELNRRNFLKRGGGWANRNNI